MVHIIQSDHIQCSYLWGRAFKFHDGIDFLIFQTLEIGSSYKKYQIFLNLSKLSISKRDINKSVVL